jgi:hypothetical protein
MSGAGSKMLLCPLLKFSMSCLTKNMQGCPLHVSTSPLTTLESPSQFFLPIPKFFLSQTLPLPPTNPHVGCIPLCQPIPFPPFPPPALHTVLKIRGLNPTQTSKFILFVLWQLALHTSVSFMHHI